MEGISKGVQDLFASAILGARCLLAISGTSAYGRLDGGVYTVFLVITDEVSEGERDDFLRIFSHHACLTNEAFWWRSRGGRRT
jgi:hypothetical protein